MRYNKAELEDYVRSIPEDKKVIFCVLVCEKLFPNYVFFHKVTEWGNPNVLEKGMVFLYDFVLNRNFNVQEGESLLKEIDLNTPDTEDFDGIEVSFALDAANAVYSTIKYLLDGNIQHISDVMINATDTVDMFIQEKYDLDMSQKDSERKISEDPLMIREKERQINLLRKLKDLGSDKITSQTIKNLREDKPIIDLDIL